MVGPPLAFDAVLDLCRDKQRRIVLAVLAEQRRRLTVNDLTKTIVKYNHHTPVREVSGAESKRIAISLHHVHLPMLESHSLVEYDQERQLVEPTDAFDRLEPHLSAMIDADPDLEVPVEL